MKFFFAGHTSFGNRGCEALIRSTVGLLRARLPQAQFVVPSNAIALDRRQWHQAESLGVKFVATPDFPGSIKWWNRAARVLPLLERRWVPHHRLPASLRAEISSCDAMIMSGGDVISLDYGLASLFDWTGYAENAIDLNRPVAIWAGSIGPFKRKPHVESFITQHLKQYTSISVRESATFAYMGDLGIKTDLVADPAFTLVPEAFDHEPLMPLGDAGCLGFNVSPLIRGYRRGEASRDELDIEIIAFVTQVLAETELGVLMIPHVGPLEGGSNNSDYHYMKGLLQRANLDAQRLRIAPPTLNAAQLKHLIAQCRFFIGARTHATIAAFSTGVPTISIAYSVKAKGINNDLFGNLDYVLETPAVSASTLQTSLHKLLVDEKQLKAFLLERIPGVRLKSGAAADQLILRLSGNSSQADSWKEDAHACT